MKKISSLLLVALFSVSAMAQVQSKAEQMMPAQMNAKHSVQMKGEMDLTPATLNLTQNKKAAANAAAAAADTLDYLRPVGAFFVGMSSDLGLYYPRIICDTIDSLTFYNNSALHTGNQMYWWLNSAQGSFLDTTWNLVLDPLPEAYYYYPMPSLVTVDADGENILNSYQYGSYHADNSVVLAKPDYTMPLTTCAMYTDTLIEPDNGQDYWAVGAGTYGKYAYGSNLNVGTEAAPVYPDTLMVLFDNMSTMYMDSAFLTIYNYDANSIAEMIPAGATITLDLLPLGVQNGQTVILPTPISTATATNTDAYVYNFSGGGVVASLNFAFGTKNSLGGFTPTPITYSGPFVARLSGFSSNGCNFGIYSDYYYSDYQTYFVINGNMTGLWKSPNNILLSLNAMFVDRSQQGVENVAGDAMKPVKIIRDGQVLIQKGEKLYNVMGAEL